MLKQARCLLAARCACAGGASPVGAQQRAEMAACTNAIGRDGRRDSCRTRHRLAMMARVEACPFLIRGGDDAVALSFRPRSTVTLRGSNKPRHSAIAFLHTR